MSEDTTIELLHMLQKKNLPERTALLSERGNIETISQRALIHVLLDEHENRETRCTAAWLLGKLSGEEATDALISLLAHKDILLSLDASRALKDKGYLAVVPLIKALGDPKLRAHAITVLGWIGDKHAVKPLVSIFQSDVDEISRWRAADALGRIGDRSAVEPLIEVLKNVNDSITVRQYCAWALGELGDMRAVDALTKSLEETDWDSWEVRWQSVQALRQLGDIRAISPLIGALDDMAEVRYEAILALRDIGDMRALPALAKIERTDGEKTYEGLILKPRLRKLFSK